MDACSPTGASRDFCAERDHPGARPRYASVVRARWFSRRSLLLHLALLIWVPGCATACWWQITVALSGDHLADLYSVEWPIFAIFGVVFWWHQIHDDPASVGAAALARARAAQELEDEALGIRAASSRRREGEDADLAAYNDYLAGLAARDAAKTWRRS